MSLIGQWILNGNLKDNTKYHHDLVMTSSSPSYGVGIVTDKAWSGGSTIYPYTTGITLGPYSTITCWALMNATGDMLWGIQCNAYSSMNIYTNSIYTLNIGDDNANPFQDTAGNSISVLADSIWHHYAVTFNGADKARLYIDGVYRGQAKTYRDSTMNSGTFTIGSWSVDTNYVINGRINDVRIYDEVLSTKRIQELSQALMIHYKLDERILPSSYTQLEYIESSHTQYIDTGVTIDSSGYEINAEITHLNTTKSSGTVPVLFGSEAVEYKWGMILASATGTYYSLYNGNSLSTVTCNGILGAKNKIRWITSGSKQSFYVNDIPLAENIAFTYVAQTTTLCLFGDNTGNYGFNQLVDMRLHSFSIKKGSTLLRDFVPAKDSSSVVGLYDLVTGTFYTNSGSGSFTAGAVVNTHTYELYNLSTKGGAGGWNNSGTATWNSNDTSITAKVSTCPVYSITKGTAGNSCITFGSSNSSEEMRRRAVTCSSWVYLSGTITNSVFYLRSNQTDSNIGTMSYNGVTSPTSWPTSQWIRVSWTGVVPGDTYGFYFCRYINNASEYFAVNGWQIEYGNVLHSYCGDLTCTRHLISDSSGYDNHGVIRSDHSPVFKQGGGFGSGYAAFTGSTNVGYIASTLNIGNKWSWSAWVRIPADTSDTTWRGVVLLGKDAGGDANTKLGAFTYRSTNRWQSSANGKYNDSVTYTYDSNWKLMTVTYDGSSMKTYINGALAATNSITDSDIGATNLTIGAQSTHAEGAGISVSNYLIGDIAEVKIYGTVLSATTIADSYKERAAITKLGEFIAESVVEDIGESVTPRSGYEYKLINSSASTGTYTLNLPGDKYVDVYCDMSTKDVYGRTGWMCVGSWSEACEWTKASTSTVATQGATPANCISSNFADCEIHAFRILVSDSITNTGSNATADFYYYYETPVRWKNVWFASAGSIWVDNARETLKPFDFSYNLKYSYKLASHKYNRVSDYTWNGLVIGGTSSFTYSRHTTSYKAITTPGYSFDHYSSSADGSLGLLASGSTGTTTGQDLSSHNVKIGYDDGTACKVAYQSASGAGSDTSDTSASGKKMWWFIL